MAECAHVTLTLEGDHLTCTECHNHTMTLTVDNQEWAQFLQLVEGIIQHLEQAGMTDTATLIRDQASRLIVNRRIVWNPGAPGV